ncbi:chitin synthase [Nematocida displodere]|uniref:chitin synthase n=1 Tax=Nematocida displodere TaxID=1805483 RepID=A0A177EL41_9MICR|nr:chitin synthase [Nematocida displodere]
MEVEGFEETPRIVIRPKDSAWLTFSTICTSFIPSFMLRVFGMKSKEMRNAWREKVALCWMIAFACCCLAFLTYGMTMLVCNPTMFLTPEKVAEIREDDPWVIARGKILEVSPGDKLANSSGNNVSTMFKLNAPSCQKAFGKDIANAGSLDISDYGEIGPVNYTWSSVLKNKLTVIGTSVYDTNNAVLPEKVSFLKNASDATRASECLSDIELQCFKESCYAGELAIKSVGCQITDAFLYLSCVAIMGLVLSRFFLAVAYSVVSRVQNWRLLRRSSDSMPVILMTACYSEGREGLKATLDSLCQQEYDNKLIVVVADGVITGSGNDASTPEILKSLITPASSGLGGSKLGDWATTPQQYISIASGSSKVNYAEVHPGTYTASTKTGPVVANIILILKTSNRGKRDSQMIIMNFFHRVLYKTRMTQLDYDLHRKIKELSGIVPDTFGAILMVDADTSVRQGAVRTMARTMLSDETIMGVCGETLISNKFGSWVTAIQVFEYYVSHHMAKGFESVFGNVTCLPGCFCMYRIRIKREEAFSPVLVAPEIMHSYGSDETKTLHEKNLLLLGEDRYLSTLLLKTFPKKKLMFLPSALCDTVVPDKFSVLLSQRRRWINSTIHNLFELLKVDLCGSFCCSMQFVVILELFGTLVLPAAILFTGVLIATAFILQPVWIPLILLFAILGLPAGLIFFTNFNPFYFFWLVVYLISLPIWNFILPVYAFWHFDDFSWGETRRVDSPEAAHDKAEETASQVSEKITLMSYEDFEAAS